MDYKYTNHSNREGFTLLQMALVVIIIGLITGGILVGQNLIESAAISATISQMSKYNSAANTFQTRYGSLPGDILYSSATQVGLAATTSGGAGLGDDNGLIQDPNGNNTPVGEILLFWRQLSDAGLIDQTLGSDLTVSTAQAPATITLAKDFPAAKFGANYIIVGSNNGYDYFGITGLQSAAGGAAGTAAYGTKNTSFTPTDAYNIDQKIDDGFPISGFIQARGTGSGDILAALVATNAPSWTAGASLSACVIGGSGYATATSYNIGGSGANIINCTLRLQFN